MPCPIGQDAALWIKKTKLTISQEWIILLGQLFKLWLEGKRENSRAESEIVGPVYLIKDLVHQIHVVQHKTFLRQNVVHGGQYNSSDV